MKKLITAIAVGVMLSGCSTDVPPAEAKNQADQDMFYALLESVWHDQSSVDQDNICTNWEADPELIRMVFIVEISKMPFYQESSLNLDDIDPLVVSFFSEECRR